MTFLGLLGNVRMPSAFALMQAWMPSPVTVASVHVLQAAVNSRLYSDLPCREVPNPTIPSVFFEIFTPIEEYRSVEYAKKMLLPVHRMVWCDNDEISITHVCCSRRYRNYNRCGRGVYLSEGDMWEVIEGEEDFIHALEKMQEFILLSFTELRTELMEGLKETIND